MSTTKDSDSERPPDASDEPVDKSKRPDREDVAKVARDASETDHTVA